MVLSTPLSHIFLWLIARTRTFPEYTACLIQILDIFRINNTYFFWVYVTWQQLMETCWGFYRGLLYQFKGIFISSTNKYTVVYYVPMIFCTYDSLQNLNCSTAEFVANYCNYHDYYCHHYAVVILIYLITTVFFTFRNVTCDINIYSDLWKRNDATELILRDTEFLVP
jgi:hypothetical protein